MTTDLSILKISNGHISAKSYPLNVWFYGGVLGLGGSNGAISGVTKFNKYMYVGKTMREE